MTFAEQLKNMANEVFQDHQTMLCATLCDIIRAMYDQLATGERIGRMTTWVYLQSGEDFTRDDLLWLEENGFEWDYDGDLRAYAITL